MKKIISILMIAVMLVSVFAIPAFADSYDDFPPVENKYYDKAVEHNCQVEPEVYKEFHHYTDENSEEPDWALIACINTFIPWEVKHGALVGDRVIWNMAGTGWDEFEKGYAVYIPKTDTFIALVNDNVEEIIELCPEFVETMEEYGIGQLMGDIDEDGIVNIVDATYIQRRLAGRPDYFTTTVQTIEDGTLAEFSITDFNRDGDTTILDATAIQRKLAKLD